MKIALAFALLSTVVLSGCGVNRTHPIVSPRTQQTTPESGAKASTAEMMVNQDLSRVTAAEMGRCFRSEANRNGAGRIYTVVNDARSGKKCSVIVARDGRGETSASVRATAEGMSVSDCQLKALSCARPALASRNVSRFGLEIDKVPFAKK